jgi:hypothetical protein
MGINHSFFFSVTTTKSTSKYSGTSKMSEGVMGNLRLYVASELPSARIGPSLADRSRVELALFPHF